jgi:tetratricopeptide (TPR) repeat protein
MMKKQNSSDTKPIKVSQKAASRSFLTNTNISTLSRNPLVWFVLFGLIFFLFITIGAAAGYNSGLSSRDLLKEKQVDQEIEEQFQMGVQDLEAGKYEIALHRFEYVMKENPNYPGITEKLSEAMAVVYSTATPTLLPPTITPTPSHDFRSEEEMFNHAVSLVVNGNWGAAIDTLLSLRKTNKEYLTAKVDDLLFIALRNWGVMQILQEGNLESGMYNLSLAEKFVLLDIEASQARQWARLYMIGLSFWEVHPEQAVFYFSQVAASAPYLHDISGWTAVDRYRDALIQYGDLLFKQEKWCDAQTQYEMALNLGAPPSVREKFDATALLCSPPTITPTLGTETITPTNTQSVGATYTPTPNSSPTLSPTNAFSPTPSETPIPTTEATPTPSITNMQPPPTETQTPEGSTQPNQTPGSNS